MFFTPRVVRHWNGLPSGVVDALCLSAFKRHLDNALTLPVSPELLRQLD